MLMKSPLFFLILLLLSVAPIHAGNARLPSNGAMKLSMTIPDGWTTEVDDEGVLNAESPDEELGLSAWALDKADIENLKDAAHGLERILGDCATQIRVAGAPHHGQVGNVRTVLFEGTGIDTDDKSPVRFRALLLFGGPGGVTVLYLAADIKAAPQRLAVIDQIVRSVRAE